MTLVRPGVTCFFGQTYTGKTTLMLRQLEREAARGLVFDPSASRALDRYPVLSSLAGARQFFGRHSAGRWIRTVRTADLSLYASLARTVKWWRGVVWVLDDANALLEEPDILAAAKSVATAGRHMGNRTGVELWVIAQRPMFVHPTIRSQAQRIFSFAQAEPADLRYLQERGGEAFASTVRGLTGHQFTSWPPTTEGEQWARTSNPPRTPRAVTTPTISRPGTARHPLRLAK